MELFKLYNVLYNTKLEYYSFYLYNLFYDIVNNCIMNIHVIFILLLYFICFLYL